MKTYPNYAQAWSSKGLAFHRLGKYEEATKCYDKALEIDPNYVTAWNNKGLVPNARLSSAVWLEDD